MMTRNRELLLDILRNLIAFLAFYGIAAVAMEGMTGNQVYVYGLVLMLIPFYVMFAVRRKVKSFVAFMLSFLAMIAAAVMIPAKTEIKFILTTFTLACAVYTVVKRVKPKKEILKFDKQLPFLAIAINIALLAAAQHMFNMEFVRYPLIFSSLVIILCSAASINIINVDSSLSIITGDKHVAVNVVRFNNAIILVFMAVLVTGAVFSGFLPIERAFDAIGGVLLAVIRFIARSAPTAEGPDLISNEISDGAGLSPGIPAERELTGFLKFLDWFMNFLKEAVVYLFAAFVVIGLIAAIAYAIYALYKKFNSEYRKDADIKEFIKPDFTAQSIFEGIRLKINPFGSTPSGRLRYSYYKKVTSFIKKGADIRRSDTPSEIAEKVRSRENIDNLTQQYEKLRYGRTE